MIFAYTGKTGSGKTYRMTKDAFHAWKQGIDIYSNTILLFEIIDSRTLWVRLFCWLKKINYDTFCEGGHYIRKKETKVNLDFKSVHTYPAGKEYRRRRGRIRYFEDITEILEARDGIILFDEAQVLFNAREWESLPAEFMYKLQQSRKHNLDLFCTTQSLSRIDIVYRQLVHTWYHHECVWQLGQNPVWFGVFRQHIKDIDELFNQVDDNRVPNLKSHIFLIHRLKVRLYDTLFDIGFKRFKTLWQTTMDQSGQPQHKVMIVPRRLDLSSALRQMSLFRSGSSRTRFQISKKS